MEGKAAIANKTTSCVFRLLQDAGEVSFVNLYLFHHLGKRVNLFAQIFIQNDIAGLYCKQTSKKCWCLLNKNSAMK